MELGVSIWPVDYGMPAADIARAVEERGLDSLFFPEHIHIPASRKSPFPSGGELPKQYYHGLDPFPGLGAAAAVTQRIKLGTGVCLVVERDPITLAKAVASVDFISNGRFVFGIGGGWNREEMENHGTDPKKRFGVLRDRIAAMKAIWTQHEAEYHGEYVAFDPIWQWPKPVQKPYPPIVYGGDGPTALKRVVDYCDGWMPIAGRNETPIEDRVAELSRLAEEAGRPRPTVTMSNTPVEAAFVERLQKAGVNGCTFRMVPGDADTVLPQLDKVAEVARQIR